MITIIPNRRGGARLDLKHLSWVEGFCSRTPPPLSTTRCVAPHDSVTSLRHYIGPKLVPTNALVLTEPINSETIVREHLVVWLTSSVRLPRNGVRGDHW
jgi:hypothetical protein